MPHDILPNVRKRWVCAAAMLALSLLSAASSLSPEVLQLAGILSKARLGLTNVPAYACSESIARSNRVNSRTFFRRLDELKLEVAQIGAKELYAQSATSSFQDTPLTEMIDRGLVSTGMFYPIAEEVFASASPSFTFVEYKRFRKRDAVRYDFVIEPFLAKYRLNFNGHTAACGIRGSIWADKESLDLMRMQIEATEMPLELGVRSAVTTIDYNRAPIGVNSFLIPSSAEVLIMMMNGQEDRNEIKFANCRKYGAESTLSFQ